MADSVVVVGNKASAQSFSSFVVVLDLSNRVQTDA